MRSSVVAASLAAAVFAPAAAQATAAAAEPEEAGRAVCGAVGAERAGGIYTLRLAKGEYVLPCEPAGLPHYMTRVTALLFLDALGLSGHLGPLLDRSSDLDNPSINRDIVRVGRAASLIDGCLRRASLLPELPSVATPVSEYMERVRRAAIAAAPRMRGESFRCLREAETFKEGADWSAAASRPRPVVSPKCIEEILGRAGSQWAAVR